MHHTSAVLIGCVLIATGNGMLTRVCLTRCWKHGCTVYVAEDYFLARHRKHREGENEQWDSDSFFHGTSVIRQGLPGKVTGVMSEAPPWNQRGFWVCGSIVTTMDCYGDVISDGGRCRI